MQTKGDPARNPSRTGAYVVSSVDRFAYATPRNSPSSNDGASVPAPSTSAFRQAGSRDVGGVQSVARRMRYPSRRWDTYVDERLDERYHQTYTISSWISHLDFGSSFRIRILGERIIHRFEGSHMGLSSHICLSAPLFFTLDSSHFILQILLFSPYFSVPISQSLFLSPYFSVPISLQ